MDYANSAPAVTVDFNNSNHTPYRLSAGSISADRRYVVVDSAATRSVTGYDSSSNVVTTASDTDNCSDTFTCDGSAYLFAINDMSGGSPAFLWGNKAKVKFFGGTVKTVGGTLCCNFVPCLKNGTEPGVYDTVRDVFLPNSGSGTFTYGAVIGVISYSIPAFFPPSVSDLTATGATVTCELIALGEGATSANVWFTYTDRESDEAYPLKLEKVREILALNAEGKNGEAISGTKKEKIIDFKSAAGEDSITRLDEVHRKKKGKPRGKMRRRNDSQQK